MLPFLSRIVNIFQLQYPISDAFDLSINSIYHPFNLPYKLHSSEAVASVFLSQFIRQLCLACYFRHNDANVARSLGGGGNSMASLLLYCSPDESGEKLKWLHTAVSRRPPPAWHVNWKLTSTTSPLQGDSHNLYRKSRRLPGLKTNKQCEARRRDELRFPIKTKNIYLRQRSLWMPIKFRSENPNYK